MKSSVRILLWLAFSVAFARDSFAQMAAGRARGFFRTGVKVFTGVAAAKAVSNVGNSSLEHRNAREDVLVSRRLYELAARAEVESSYASAKTEIEGAYAAAKAEIDRAYHAAVADIESTRSALRSHGGNSSQSAIYSLFFNLNPKASSIYWADTFSYPDLFFIVAAEGQEAFILPEVRWEYRGGSILDRFVSTPLIPGRKVSIWVMDDDTLGDEVWKSILSTKVDWRLNIGGTPVVCNIPIPIRFDASGPIQILRNAHRVKIDAPDYIASVVFTVPVTRDATWTADAELIDAKNWAVGRLQFTQIWNAGAELESAKHRADAQLEAAKRTADNQLEAARKAADVRLQSARKNALDGLHQAEKREADAFGSIVWWGGIAILLIVIVASMIPKPADGRATTGPRQPGSPPLPNSEA